MKISFIVKSIFAITASLLISIELASVYSSYASSVDPKNLSVIFTIVLLLGLASIQQKKPSSFL